MAWQTPKTSWKAGDIPLASDFNRIEGNVGELDTKKANQADLASHTDASAPHSGHATTTALTAHTSAAAPHSGHETPSGAQDKVDAHSSQSAPHSGHATTSALSTHTSATSAHSATSAATANRIMLRNAAGRAKVAAPAAADDIARKDTVDAKFHATTGHKHTGATGDGPILKEISWIELSDNVLFERLEERTNPEIENYVVLRPGKYRLTWEWRSSSGTESMRVRVRLEGYDYLSPASLFGGSASTSSTSYVSGTMDVDVVIPAGAVIAIDWYERSQRRNLRIKGTPQPTGAEHVLAIT